MSTGPAWRPGTSTSHMARAPRRDQGVDLRRGEHAIGSTRLHHLGDGQAAGSASAKRLEGAPMRGKTRQVAGALVGEGTLAMTSESGRMPEQLLEHDGTSFREDSITVTL